MKLTLAASPEVSEMASAWENGGIYEIVLSVQQTSFSDKKGFSGEAEIIDSYPADEDVSVDVEEEGGDEDEMPPPPPPPIYAAK